MSPKEWRENKHITQKEMQRYDKNFVASEYAYNRREKRYGEITMQNFAGAYVDYKPFTDCVSFRTNWSERDCVYFANEKEMLVHKLKNSDGKI